MIRVLAVGALALAACGPSRTTYARYPGAPPAFDRAGSDPKALEIADQVFAACGGPTGWEAAKQIRWSQTVTSDGKVSLDGEEAWDRWNARHYGRLHRSDGSDLVVAYDLYGDKAIGFVEVTTKFGRRQQKLDDASRVKAVKIAQGAFNVDTAVLTIQFLLLEPGAKLAYVGQTKDDAGADHYDEIMVTFADPLRSGYEFHTVVDRTSHLIQRVEIQKAGTNQKIGYTLKDWTTVGGLKFATSRGNMGYSGETIAIKDLKVSGPDDDLFIAPITN